MTAQETGSVRFLANFIPPSGGGYTAGCWGWTDSAGGREYALLGNSTGTSIVEITDVGNIVERDFIPGPASNWRELMTWGHYAYVVSEGGGGTQIIDLSYLPDSAHLVRSFVHTSGAKSTNRAHTVHVRDGYLYLNGCAQWSPGGILIFDLADPENPVFTGEYAENYVHDCFVRNDTIFAAAIYGIGVEIIDATDKSAPLKIFTISYPGSGTHNTATTADGRYVLSTDEINAAAKTLKIWDLSSPPLFPKVAEYAGSPSAIVHNVFVKDTLAIMSYYTAGIRVVDIADPLGPVEVGGYDTRPSDESAQYTGAWSVYPFFPSGKIIIGDMGNGMFVVDLNSAAPRVPSGVTAYSDYATPTGVSLAWTDPALTVGGDPLSTVELRIYRDGAFLATVPGGVQAYTDTGLTPHQLYRYTFFAVSGTDSSAPVNRTVYAGGAAAPAMPAGFRVLELSDGVRLEWTTPSTQADGTPLNDLGAIEIERDGALFTAVPAGSADTGAASAYTDTTIGYHTYRIRALDTETPTNFSPFTPPLLAYGGLTSSFTVDFETGSPTLLISGPWDTTRAIASSGTASFTDSPAGDYANNCDRLVQHPPVHRVDRRDPDVQAYRHHAGRRFRLRGNHPRPRAVVRHAPGVQFLRPCRVAGLERGPGGLVPPKRCRSPATRATRWPSVSGSGRTRPRPPTAGTSTTSPSGRPRQWKTIRRTSPGRSPSTRTRPIPSTPPPPSGSICRRGRRSGSRCITCWVRRYPCLSRARWSRARTPSRGTAGPAAGPPREAGRTFTGSKRPASTGDATRPKNECCSLNKADTSCVPDHSSSFFFFAFR